MTQKIIKLQSPTLSRRHHCFTRHILLVLQISSTDDLLNKEFKFGVLKGSPIARTLELSQTDEHKKLWQNINSHRHGLRDSNNDGIRRARWDGKYAFLIEGAYVKCLQIKWLLPKTGFFPPEEPQICYRYETETQTQTSASAHLKFYSFHESVVTIVVVILRCYSGLGFASTAL